MPRPNGRLASAAGGASARPSRMASVRRLPPLLLSVLALAAGWSGAAAAFTVDITPRNPRTLYLRVGDGAFAPATFDRGGQPAELGTVNTVSVQVPAASIAGGTPLTMAGNATQLASDYDGFAFCNAGQIYVGGFYRRNGNGNGFNATLSVNAPDNLVSASGDAVPFTDISWTSSGNGDAGAQPVPAGAFTGGQQTLAVFPVNSWRESCLTFRYANRATVPAGAYRGRVTYTLATP